MQGIDGIDCLYICLGSGTDSDSDDMPELEEQDPGVASQQAAVAAAAGIQVSPA